MTTQARAEATLPFDEALAAFDPVMGLEVHVELNTATKMFCGCPTEFGAEPNTQICPVCLGLPGALPVVNVKAVESAIRIGLVLNCEIAPWCRFARKNYFYPDMPKNFQTSQYDEPIAFDGFLDVELDDGTVYRVEIERAHMEEDTGKSLHVGGSTGRIHGATHSLVDYNRAGIPLIEIVTKPMRGAGERAPEIARAYVATLRDLLKALDVSDVRMEQGSMRCDVNLSLMPKGADDARHPLGDQERQLAALGRAGGALRDRAARGGAAPRAARSSRRPGTGTRTPASRRPGRVKSDADDYRYFPEPDLVPVAPTRETGRGAARHAARAAGRPAQAAAGRLGLRRPRDARRRQRRARRARRGDRGRGRLAGGGAQVVVGGGRPPRQRRGPGRPDLRRGARGGPGIRRRAGGARDVGAAQRLDGPAGLGGRALR